MNKVISLIVGLLVLVVFVLYMVTYQVRYDEVAIVTTFGKATPPDAATDDSGSIVTEPGLYFKAPAPFQNVASFSRKLNILEDQAEEFQTADQNSVIVRTFLAWRIEDPYSFFITLNNVDNAQQKLRPLLADLRGVISEYTFDEMVNLDADQIKLAEIEAKAADRLRQQLAAIEPGYGISIEQFGIRRILLPESTTEKVFEQMKTTQERLAQAARSEGDAAAKTITTEAESAKQRILAFAERRANEIRARGESEAAEYYKTFAQDEAFATFLRKVETWKNTLSNNTTFVISADEVELVDEFLRGPQIKPQEGTDVGSQARQ